MSRTNLAGASTTALICLLAPLAMASGGGGGGMMGGGGGSMPSASAPRYNAVEEYGKGVTALKAADYRVADRAFGHVLEVAPHSSDALYAMGLTKVGETDLKAAARYYARAAKADPRRLDARRELAITEAQLGQTDKATSDLTALQAQAVTCANACPEADALKASVAAIQAALTPPTPAAAGSSAGASPSEAAALAHPDLLFASTQTGDGDYVAAVRLINQHRYAEAFDQLKAAQSAFGPHPDILTYLGYVSRKLGRLDDAESYYRQALAIYPDHVGATEYYGELKVVRGDMAGAHRMLRKLEVACTFGCVEAEDLRRWIDAGHEPS